MSLIQNIIINESIEDALLYFAPTNSYPGIDRMYVKYKFQAIESGELLATYKRLLAEGKLTKDAGGKTIKGPKWKEPAFIKQKKYTVA